MLKAARQRMATSTNVDIREGSLEALPIDDATLDVAVLSLVLHYVADPAAALAGIRRTLRPDGGRLLLVDMLPHDRAE
jgi:ArsR family transcriptional regulator